MRLSRVLVLALAGAACAVLPQAPAVAAPNTQTVPAIQQWTAGSGTYTFTSGSRIVVDPAFASALNGDAATFATDLGALAGRTISVTQLATPATGDIFLTLGGSDAAEGYTMTVGTAIRLQGSASAGVFFGTRTVLQLLKQSYTIAAGTARDWPVKPERGLMVDQGRKFFTVDWLKKHIKELSYLKLNVFHFHLSDTFGSRVQSTTHPETVSAQHYTKAQIAELVALGNQYHVQVIPEIDMPGHMNAILAQHPELQLENQSGQRDPYFLDLSEAGAYTLVQDLITEYMPLFPSRYWHMGADEYVTNYSAYPQLLTYARAHYGANATAKDSYYGFINWVNDLVRANGKTLRMWNDGIKSGDGTINPATNIHVEYWYNYGLTPQQLLDRGHTISNESWDPTYYVLGGDKPDNTWAYETWQPNLFQGGTTINNTSRNTGSRVHVWCDNPNAETEDQIAGGIKYTLRVLAQQTWGSPKPAATYTSWQVIADAVGRAPGWPSDTPPGNLALGKPVTASSTETSAFPAANAVDGSYGSRWASAYTDPSWIQVDLGSSVSLNRVVLRWEAAFGRGYQIQVSNDATNWTTVYTTTTGDGGVDDLAITGTGRYLRMYGTARGTSWGYSLWEIEAYGGTTAPNKALNKPVAVSSTETANFPGSSAVDGSGTTRWSSLYVDPSWIRVDLGSTQSISRVVLRWEAAFGRAYQIQTSPDGTNWTTIYSTAAGDGGVDDVAVSGSGRYVRMNGTARGTSWGYSLWEFEIY
ncbi:family 20 glycosylhydrolase [Catelliglobosispora koreensis]|uniref:family 20 glycosylhydrolase n=1 Tax=Catelliglobosispora koreensis TaxID=129052 RepID=UPI000685CEC6|nr:family 20 glycosylhydrolase [Catelliglobosispora koreensis]